MWITTLCKAQMAHASEYDRTIELCKFIMRKGELGFEQFVFALRASGNALMADILTNPLTTAEKSQSFEQALLALDITRSPKLGAAVQEIESFNVMLVTTDELRLVLNGVPGRLSMSEILTEYAVVNNSEKVLFNLIWRPVDAVRIELKLTNSLLLLLAHRMH